jgi:DNA-binding MarR family transcriptional regulator
MRQTLFMARDTLKHSEKAGDDRRRRSETLASELREVASALVRRLRAESAGQVLSMSQMGVLARLDRSGPSTVADLARGEHVTPQSMGTTVASLEEEGFVARTVDPNDARRWNASLTAAGKRILLDGRAVRQAWLRRAIEESLAEGEQRRLADGVALLRKVLGQ